MRSPLILQVLFLAMVTNSLRWKKNLHRQTDNFVENATNATIDNIESQLSMVNLQIAAINRTLSQNLFIISEEEGQIRLLNKNESLNNDHYNRSRQCIVLNQTETQDVMSYLIQAEENQKNITKLLSKLAPSSIHQDLSKLHDTYQKQIEKEKFILQNPCSYEGNLNQNITVMNITFRQKVHKHLPNTSFVNRKQQNYLLGNMSELPQNNCSQDKPYIIDGVCQNCSGDWFLFDVQKQQCVSCPNGTYFSEKNHSCLSKNHSSRCLGNQYENMDGLCLCRREKPFWDGENCIDCFAPKYFNWTGLECTYCQTGYNYSVVNQSCVPVPCPEQQIFNSETQNCTCQNTSKHFIVNGNCSYCSEGEVEVNRTCVRCQNNLTFDYETQRCTCNKNESLFWNGEECELCSQPKYWDEAELSCASCPQNTTYDSVFEACVRCPSHHPLFNGNFCEQCPPETSYNRLKQSCQCPKTKIFNQNKQKCECPSSQFETEQGCIQCYLPKYFDVILGICTSCKGHQTYDLFQSKCVDCPSSHPKFDGQKCTQCILPSYWSPAVKDCVQCTNGQHYNPSEGRCVCEEGSFFTGEDCIKCFLPNYFDVILRQCLSCPHNQIYNVLIGECVNCPPSKPKFDGQKCSECQNGTFWNASAQDCTCSNGTVYNPETLSCECESGKHWNGTLCLTCFLDTQYWDREGNECKNCSRGKQYNLDKQKCQCPSSKPFQTETECISCYLPQYFDPVQKKCLHCQKNTIFNVTQKQCVQCPIQAPISIKNRCVPCSDGLVYNTTSQQCESMPVSGSQKNEGSNDNSMRTAVSQQNEDNNELN